MESFSSLFHFKVYKNSGIKKYVLQHSLTIVTVETSPNKLVVVRDLVDNGTKTAYTVLYNLRTDTTNDIKLKLKLVV